MSPPFPVTDKGILNLEQKVGLESGFFAALYDEDDWSFVIKLHALMEAACTHLLMFHFNEPALVDVLSRLELSGKTVGKTVFLGKLGLLGKEYRRFISALSELRNDLVHDIRNSRFTLHEFVASLDLTAQKNFAISFSPFESVVRSFPDLPAKPNEERPSMKEGTSIPKMIQRATADSKLHVWLGAYATLVQIVEMYGYSDYKQWVKAKNTFGDDIVEV
jgi:hypothetical protein